MPRFTVNSHRFDPYSNFKFKISVNGQYVAGLNKCSALRKTTEVTTWHEAGDQSSGHKIPGKTSYEPITLEQGVTYDVVFEEWANAVNNFQGDAAMSLKTFRRLMRIEVNDLQGNTVMAYNVHNSWVSEYQAIADLDASGNAVLIRRVVVQNEGWERDTAEGEKPER